MVVDHRRSPDAPSRNRTRTCHGIAGFGERERSGGSISHLLEIEMSGVATVYARTGGQRPIRWTCMAVHSLLLPGLVADVRGGPPPLSSAGEPHERSAPLPACATLQLTARPRLPSRYIHTYIYLGIHIHIHTYTYTYTYIQASRSPALPGTPRCVYVSLSNAVDLQVRTHAWMPGRREEMRRHH